VVLHYGFEGLGLHRIFARHFTRNPASGRVLQKLGMRHEGCLRQHALKWGVFEDTEFYGILKTDAEMLQQR
jgi:[ribosomal protein S5]-alanine N-acetyltransferase